MIFINAETNSKIHIGRAGEHKITTVVFDISDWIEEVRNEIDPDLGAVELIVEQNSISYPQLIEYNREEKKVYWIVTHSNTSEPGIGKCELFYFGEKELTRLFKKPDNWEAEYTEYYDAEGNKLVEGASHEWNDEWKSYSDDIPYFYMARPTLKTALYEIIVTNALGYNEEDPPGPYESWVDNVLNASADTKQAVVDAKANADRVSALAKEVDAKAAQTAQNASDAAEAVKEAQTAQRLADAASASASTSASASSESAAAAAASKASAIEAKTAAQTAQSGAEAAHSAAESAASSASTSAGQASVSEQNAAGSASVASTKANEAAESARSAEDNASKAEKSASSAANSAHSAASSEINALNYENNAKIYRDDALEAKTAAESAAESVASSATAAAESASDAANSASTASSKASDAVKSASSAADSASSANIAMTAAQNAQKAAEEARDKAKQYVGNPPIPDENTKTWWVYDPEDLTANEDGYVNTNVPYNFNIDYIVKNQSELATITGMKIGDIAAIQAAISDPMNAQLYMYSGNDSSNGWEFLLDLSGATGNGISSISKTSSTINEQGNIVDTYTITYTLSDPTTFTVVNGKDGADGIGSGDMLKKDYDQDGVVKTAGGIVKYVESQIQESGTGVVWKKWISTDMI